MFVDVFGAGNKQQGREKENTISKLFLRRLKHRCATGALCAENTDRQCRSGRFWGGAVKIFWCCFRCCVCGNPLVVTVYDGETTGARRCFR